MKPADQSEQRAKSLDEKLFLSRYPSSPLDDIDAHLATTSRLRPPPIARNIGNIGGRDWRHRAARMRRARLTMIVDATNDCAAASSGTETIEEKINSMFRRSRLFERQPSSTDALACSAARPRSDAERLGVDVDSDAPHLVGSP
jgi:hypothetical protein